MSVLGGRAALGQSYAAIVERRTLRVSRSMVFAVIALAAFVGIGAYTDIGTWFAFRLREHDVGFVILAFGTAVLPNIMWYHHYVYLLLPIFILMGISGLRTPVVLWCGALMTDIQIERWHGTRGLTAHLMVHFTILALLFWLGRRLWLERRAPCRQPLQGAGRESAATRPANRRPWGFACPLNIGNVSFERGDYTRARVLFEEASPSPRKPAT